MRPLLITVFAALVFYSWSCKTSDSNGTHHNSRFIERLQPAPVNGGFEMEGYWVWGMSVIKGDSLYHGYASRWPKSVPFAPNWMTHSEIVHATSRTPEGPYEFQEVVFERRGSEYWDGMTTHNPTIHKIGDTYLLYYIGMIYDFVPPDSALTQEQIVEARSSQRIGLATASSPWGPWQRKDKPILKPRPGEWDALFTNNPAPVVRKDSSVLLIYKSTRDMQGLLKLGAAEANHFEGPYTQIGNEPILEWDNPEDTDRRSSKHVEDPYVWWSGNRYELIAKDMTGQITGQRGAGLHAWSENGTEWNVEEHPLAYTRNVVWANGDTLEMAAFERPQLLIQDGVPTHLFAATGINSEGDYWKFEKTWNVSIPLAH
ncbi:glycoside hydrolase family protein [Halalkalibaculum sp. DA384]|uniref:glycoside hydrolase family protein n=1 Tax=Halalkalibaculum sp. DA384 TaxID=3373606 RepID=UPI00375460C9